LGGIADRVLCALKWYNVGESKGYKDMATIPVESVKSLRDQGPPNPTFPGAKEALIDALYRLKPTKESHRPDHAITPKT
jgi:hypothetical protein